MVVSPVCWQILATLAAASSTFGWGCSIGLSATLISKLRHKDFGLAITDEDASWIGSCLAIGGVVGSLMTGFLMNAIGRKSSLILWVLVSIVGFSLTASDNIIVICIGRVICGVSVGASVMVGSVYVSEISSPKWRGTLGSCLILCLTFGIIYIYIIGALLPGYPGSWKIYNVWCVAPQILGLILLILVPESPYYLIAKNKLSKAKEIVGLLNGRDDNLIKDVIDDIEKYLDQGQSSNSLSETLHPKKNIVPDSKSNEICLNKTEEILQNESGIDNTEPFIENIKHSQGKQGLLKIILVVIGLFFFTRLCGISPISYYLVDILKRGDVALDPEWSAVGVGIIETIGCLISTYLIDRVGRKSLLITSGVGMGLFHALTAWSFYQTEKIRDLKPLEIKAFSDENTFQNSSNFSFMAVDDTNSTTHLPLIGLVGFYLTFAIGTGSVPMVILGEVFPQSIKGTAISIINCCMWILNFTISKLFFFMNTHLGTYGTFIFFSTSSVAMSMYVFLFLPETKNKTLNQIQQKVQGRKNIATS